MTTPSIVITRHKNHLGAKCFFAVVWVGDLTAERSFFGRNTARAWAEWAVENIVVAAAQTAALKEAA